MSKFTEMLECCGLIGNRRFFWRVKPTQKMVLSVNYNLRTVTFPVRIKVDTPEAAFIVNVLLGIGGILRPRRKPKITPAIIEPISVTMVNVLDRHFTGHVKPCQPMSEIGPVKDANCPVGTTLASQDGASLLPGISRIPRFETGPCLGRSADQPCKYPGLWIVVQQTAHLLLGGFNSHDAIIA